MKETFEKKAEGEIAKQKEAKQQRFDEESIKIADFFVNECTSLYQKTSVREVEFDCYVFEDSKQKQSTISLMYNDKVWNRFISNLSLDELFDLLNILESDCKYMSFKQDKMGTASIQHYKLKAFY